MQLNRVLNLYTLRYFQHARRAGNFKRSLQILPKKQPEQIVTLRHNLLENRTQLTAGQWQEVRQNLINNQKHITAKNVHSVIMDLLSEPQQLHLARNYVHELRAAQIEPNAATLGRLLRTYNAAYHATAALDNENEQEILNICNELRDKHEVLDAITCEHLIHGYVATSMWQDALPLLHMIKLSSAPTTAAYSELIIKAFKTANLDMGMQLLQEQLQLLQKKPKCAVFLAYLHTIARLEDEEEFLVNLHRLFEFMAEFEVPLSQQVAACLQDIVAQQRTGTKLKLSTTTLNSAGKCNCCAQFLRQISVTEQEFRKLRDEFMQRVLVRHDVFQKSTPEEVARFKNFIDSTAPYHCVIDGLNVAYSTGKKSPKNLAKLVAVIVDYFTQRQKHVLVLGRKHMNTWSKDVMNYIRKNADVFLTNDLTQDDPFMLYATLRSGPSTDFFSRDLMRSHAFLLGPELKSIFRRWQQEHQYSLVTHTKSGQIIVKEPVRYYTCAHRIKNTWHLPLKEDYEPNMPETFELPKNWLCIQMPS